MRLRSIRHPVAGALTDGSLYRPRSREMSDDQFLVLENSPLTILLYLPPAELREHHRSPHGTSDTGGHSHPLAMHCGRTYLHHHHRSMMMGISIAEPHRDKSCVPRPSTGRSTGPSTGPSDMLVCIRSGSKLSSTTTCARDAGNRLWTARREMGFRESEVIGCAFVLHDGKQMGNAER